MNEEKHKMYVFMGYPGSCKSSLSKTFAEDKNALYLSSDETREKLFGFRDQTRNKEVFEYIKKLAVEWASTGDCVLDATNLNRKDRMRIMNDYKKYYEMHLFCMLRPIDEIIEVNNRRKDVAPEQYIEENSLKRILTRFQLPTKEEGWKTISFKLVTEKFDINEAKFSYKDRDDIKHDNPHHSETVKQHIDFITSYCEKNHTVEWLRNLGFYHDLGKFFVNIYNEEKGYTQFIGHAAVSAYIYLIDTVIDYVVYYAKQRGTDPIEDISLYGRYISLFNFSNLGDVLNMYYLIYYHDQPYSCETKEHLINSLSKPSKPLLYWQKEGKLNIEMFADILIGFNKIDKMRED